MNLRLSTSQCVCHSILHTLVLHIHNGNMLKGPCVLFSTLNNATLSTSGYWISFHISLRYDIVILVAHILHMPNQAPHYLCTGTYFLSFFLLKTKNGPPLESNCDTSAK